jgi:unsaturated rhamnogalacturonyl hydrolase
VRARFASLFVLSLTVSVSAQQRLRPITLQVADASIERWPEGHIADKNTLPVWGFEPGIVLSGMSAIWQATADWRYLTYIKQTVDQWVQPDGSIKTYDGSAYSINDILIGRELLLLYQQTRKERYRIAAETLHKQLLTQPRTASGGMWHAKVTPNLMLLDDEYMLAPFWAEYAEMFHQPADLDDLIKQFLLLDAHLRNPHTGLMYHGWDESRQAEWANKDTGASANAWARGVGWYLMALVDTLQYIDERDDRRARLLEIFRQTSAAVELAEDKNSSLWYQLLDKPTLAGNSIESSSVLMFTYAFQKGARLGYLSAHYHEVAETAWQSILKRFVKIDSSGIVILTGTVTHIAMGAAPKNDGSDAYYLKAPIVSNDPKGIGAFLLAGSEMELWQNRSSKTGAR